MTLTVCFDALGTCFSLEPVVQALDELLGEQLKAEGQGARTVVMDWFHSAQRDFTYKSIVSPPPPPISQILQLTLPRAITYALQGQHPTTALSQPQLPDLSPITSKLSLLTPSPTLKEAYTHLKSHQANILLITNGAQATTEGYCKAAGVRDLVDLVMSCDEVGFAKPFAQVYEASLKRCEEVENKNGNDGATRWFVAAHAWDLLAARKAGYKTGLVLSEQPPLGVMNDGKNQVEGYWELYGGKPDVMGQTLLEVVEEITKVALS